MSNSINKLRLIDLIIDLTGIKGKKIIDENISTVLTRPSTIKALTQKEVEKINKLMNFCRLFNEVDFINEKPKIDSTTKAENFCKNIFKGISDREYFKMILLDTQNNFIDIITIDEGTINETAIFMREVIKEILKADASAIILTHNHPNNSLKFSDADIKTTQDIKIAVKTINVKMLDHILVTANGQTESMASLGKLC